MTRTVLLVSIALVLTLNLLPTSAQEELRNLVDQRSPEATQLLQRMHDAEKVDRESANSFGDDPTMRHYYLYKADKLKTLEDQLQGGQLVPMASIKEALRSNDAPFE